MYTLKANNRNINLKGRQLRRKGIVPAVIFGKHLEESISIQVTQRDADHFLRTNAIGYRLELDMDGEKHMVLLKDATKDPITGNLEHLGFQVLMAGEIITSIAHVFVINRDRIEGIVQQSIDEISYKALPTNLIEKIEVDLEGKDVGYAVTVADLEIANNKNIELLTPLNTLVVSIAAQRAFEETEAVTEDDDTATGESSEVPVIGEE